MLASVAIGRYASIVAAVPFLSQLATIADLLFNPCARGMAESTVTGLGLRSTWMSSPERVDSERVDYTCMASNIIAMTSCVSSF